jgi:uncharacterized protein
MADQGWRNQPPFMSETVARRTAVRIREHCLKHNQRQGAVILHGGEPLLVGPEHLRQLGAILKDEFDGSGVRVRIGIQSNGLLFSPEIGDAMLEIGATMGVSVDCPPTSTTAIGWTTPASPVALSSRNGCGCCGRRATAAFSRGCCA